MENPNEYIPLGDSRRDTVLCVTCLRENDRQAVFCQYCNAALGLTGNPDPLQRIAHEGAVYSKAVEGKPKTVVLIGVWLMFFPVSVVSVIIAFSLIFQGEGGSISFLLFWILIVVSVFSLTMLYKVTRNYFKKNETGDL